MKFIPVAVAKGQYSPAVQLVTAWPQTSPSLSCSVHTVLSSKFRLPHTYICTYVHMYDMVRVIVPLSSGIMKCVQFVIHVSQREAWSNAGYSCISVVGI